MRENSLVKEEDFWVKVDQEKKVHTGRLDKMRERKKKKRRRFLAVLIILIVVVILFLGTITSIFSFINEQKSASRTASQEVNETEEQTAVVEPTIDQGTLDLLADYQMNLEMLQARTLEQLDQTGQEAVTVLMGEIEKNIVEKKLDQLETQINDLARLLDAPYVSEGDTGTMMYRRGLLIANKSYCLPATFSPGESDEARVAFEKMKEQAAAEGINLYDFSTYRSYSTQEGLYNRYVAQDGEDEANRYSAKPGCSEHQTGLAFDIGGEDKAQWAETTFDSSAEAQWLQMNARQYGFVLRYPAGKETITGYMHESWHFRYVGAIAMKIEAQEKTLEEYLGLI